MMYVPTARGNSISCIRSMELKSTYIHRMKQNKQYFIQQFCLVVPELAKMIFLCATNKSTSFVAYKLVI